MSKSISEVLHKLKEKVIPPKSEKPNKHQPKTSNYVSRRDYGDDMGDMEKKNDEAWKKELDSNPMYQSYWR